MVVYQPAEKNFLCDHMIIVHECFSWICKSSFPGKQLMACISAFLAAIRWLTYGIVDISSLSFYGVSFLGIEALMLPSQKWFAQTWWLLSQLDIECLGVYICGDLSYLNCFVSKNWIASRIFNYRYFKYIKLNSLLLVLSVHLRIREKD